LRPKQKVKNKSWTFKISNYLQILALVVLTLSLADWKGPEQSIDIAIPEQKTIILIDQSLSMATEDVAPNRYKRAIFIARYLTKLAIGHQISILVFSNNTKRLVPFTDDIDLLDSILQNLFEHNLPKGGTSIANALIEAKSYFIQSDKSSSKSSQGNIIVLTDGENHQNIENIEFDEDIQVAFIGIGTENGGKIPMRSKIGFIYGNKLKAGKEVVSKVDSKFFKLMLEKISHAQYWQDNQGNQYLQQVLDFFEQRLLNDNSRNNTQSIREVYAYKFIVLAIIFSILSLGFKFFKRYKQIYVVLLFGLISSIFYPPLDNLYAKVNGREEDNKSNKFQYDEETLKLLRNFQNGEINYDQSMQLAKKLLEVGDLGNSARVYKQFPPQQQDLKGRFNEATLDFKNGKINEALKKFDKIKHDAEESKNDDDQIISENIKKNLSHLFQEVEKQKNQKIDKNQEKKDQDQNRDKNEQKQQDDGQSKDQTNAEDSENKDSSDKSEENQENGKDNQEKNDDKNQSEKKSEKKSEDSDEDNNENSSGEQNKEKTQEGRSKEFDQKEDEKKNENSSSDENDETNNDQDDSEKEENNQSLKEKIEEQKKNIKEKRSKQKIDGLMQRLLDEDRKTQRRLLDTSTDNNKKLEKDW